jgi:hypothetical protein
MDDLRKRYGARTREAVRLAQRGQSEGLVDDMTKTAGLRLNDLSITARLRPSFHMSILEMIRCDSQRRQGRSQLMGDAGGNHGLQTREPARPLRGNDQRCERSQQHRQHQAAEDFIAPAESRKNIALAYVSHRELHQTGTRQGRDLTLACGVK